MKNGTIEMDDALKTTIANQFKNTELGFLRIKKNLNIAHLSDGKTEKYLKQIILSTPLEHIETKGKNHYFKSFDSTFGIHSDESENKDNILKL